MKHISAKILENEKVAQGFCRMRIESPYLAKNSRPGQFVKARCSAGSDPLLRRPFGVHRILNNGIEILYEIVGKGTELLSQKRKGEEADVIGPLGNGFELNSRTAEQLNRQTILVAGGIGVAPLMALAENLAYSVERIAYREKRKMTVLIGACKRSHILCENEFKKLGADVLVATEDGSKGRRGLATDLLHDILSAKRSTPYAKIYACGPNAMLKEVAAAAKAKGAECQVSLEEKMACGVGVCLGCPVKVRRDLIDFEYKMVCKDGPVFNAEEVVW